MTLSSRLALAMVLLVVVACCLVGACAWYFLTGVSLAALASAALAGAAIAAVVALALAVAMARSVSRPLRQLTAVAKALQLGEPTVVPAGGYREIADLAAAFTDMSTRFGTRMALLELTLQSISDPVLVVDAQGKIVIANTAAKWLLGVDLSIIVRSNPFRYFLPDGVTRALPEELPLARAMHGEDVDDVEYIAEAKATGVRENIAVTARPLRDAAGTLCGAVGVVRNVTEQKRAYQALIDSEQMAQSIVDSTLDAFVQTDEACVILHWSPNAEALMGWTRTEAIGVGVEQLVFPEAQRTVHRQWVDRFLSEASADVTGGRYETPLLHKDGREFFAESVAHRAAPRRSLHHQRVRARHHRQARGGGTAVPGPEDGIGWAIDRRHRPRFQQYADRDYRHDRDPGRRRQGQSRAGVDREDDRRRGQPRRPAARPICWRSPASEPLQPIETDVNVLVGEVVQLLLPTLGRQIEIETVFDEQGWPALVDRSQLSSALVNLAINGRDAMPDGGRLVLRTNNVKL